MAANGNRAKADKPDFGVPTCGTLTWAGAFPSKDHAPTIDLMITGVWENARQRQKGGGGPMLNPGTEADMWLPWKVAEALAQAGLITQDPSDPQRFTALQQQRFMIRRDLNGQRHDYTVQAIDTQGQTVALEARVVREPPHPDAGAQPAPPQNGAPAAQARPQAANVAPPAPGAAPPAQAQHVPEAGAKEARANINLDTMREADALYRTCAAMSLHALMWLYRVPRDEIYPRTAQAGCATIMIRLEREGFQATHAAANTMRRLVDELDVEMREERRIREDAASPGEKPDPPSGPTARQGSEGVKVDTPAQADAWANRPEALAEGEDDDLPF